MFGSRAQTLINALLSFDGYFAWYYPFKESIPRDSSTAEAEARALENCRTAIDMSEIYERVSIANHKSFIPHAAIYKVSRDILRVHDEWAFSLSPLELQNAETKRTANTGGSRRLKLSTEGEARKPMRGSSQGPEQLVKTKGYSTTMALSTLRKLRATQYLRRGDDIEATPASRRQERLFGASGPGRLSTRSSGVKLERLRQTGYLPREDTCLAAFVRLLAEATTEGDATC